MTATAGPGLARALVLGAALSLPGCGIGAIFTRIDVPESEGVADAPWPELADAPSALSLRESAPDPAEGPRLIEALGVEAAVSAAEAERLSAPVFDVAALRRDADAVRRGE
ncbi:MAG: hypothetical protein ACFCUS_11250 [Rubrimonas sp.]|uniref:hypothetical protein n=1 Tax=Rubrimonas sp. TaxID=2036015 RepID=UPI002FDEE1F0